MSLNDGIWVMLQTMMSNGVGASVGLEGGYTQIGSAIASRFGRSFRLRRSDMRLLVGCGAAGAIGSAFHAPAHRRVLRLRADYRHLHAGHLRALSRRPRSLPTPCCRELGGSPFDLALQAPGPIEAVDYIPLLALGMVCALVGIAVMRGVTLTEAAFRHSHVPVWMPRPSPASRSALMALITPAVLSSGHGALGVGDRRALHAASKSTLLVLLKAVGSAISLGSGFRGGLFFCSLFLGALTGKLFAGSAGDGDEPRTPCRRWCARWWR